MIRSRPRLLFWCAALMLALASTSTLYAQSQAATPSQTASPAPAAAGQQQFFMKLIPPRPTFAQDMTPREQELMQQHASYWADQFKSGKVLIIGPVMDPKGAWGMAVLECASQAEAQALADKDPTVKAGINKIEVVPMHVFLRKKD